MKDLNINIIFNEMIEQVENSQKLVNLYDILDHTYPKE